MRRKVTPLVLLAFISTTLLQSVVPLSAAIKSKRQYSLAVLDLEVTGTISRDDAVLMSRQLREELRSLGIFEVMDRLTMVSRLQQGGILQAACPTATCAVDAGSKLGVQLVVAGTVRRVGQTFYIDAFMVHVASGEEVETVSDQFTGTVDQLIGYMDVVARKLVGVTTGQQPPVTRQPARQEVPPTRVLQEEAGGTSWLRYAALGILGAGGVAAVIIATTSGGEKTPSSGKLPDPPGFPSNP